MQSVPITTNVASSPYVKVYSLRFTCFIPILAHARCTRYNIVIKVVSDLRQVSCFLRVLLFPPPLKLTAITLLKYYWILSLILKKVLYDFERFMSFIPILYMNHEYSRKGFCESYVNRYHLCYIIGWHTMMDMPRLHVVFVYKHQGWADHKVVQSKDRLVVRQ